MATTRRTAARFPWDAALWDDGLRDFVRGLVGLRASEPALRHGRDRDGRAEGGAAMALERASAMTA